MQKIVAAPQISTPHQRAWLADIDAYAQSWPHETAVIDHFRDFMRTHADAAQRTRNDAHLTGSAWLVDRTGERVLLTHHRKLGRWLQLGGHADGDSDLAAVARREAEEESGLDDLIVEPAIFDLDRHRIPARGEDAEHWHYDLRFVVRTTRSEDFAVSDESHALAWRPIADVAAHADASLARMAQKWLARRIADSAQR